VDREGIFMEGLMCRSNKRPFESQYEDLQRHYLRMRQKQMGESKRRRVDAGTPRRESEVTADGVGDAGAATGVSSDDGEGIEPGDLQEFSRMLSMTTKRSKLEVGTCSAPQYSIFQW